MTREQMIDEAVRRVAEKIADRDWPGCTGSALAVSWLHPLNSVPIRQIRAEFQCLAAEQRA